MSKANFVDEHRSIQGFSDSMLMEGVRQGDERAFEALFRRYYQRVYGVAYRLLGSHDEAEDLAQETFVQLHRHPLSNGKAVNVGAWLFRVATNLGYNALRSRSRQDKRRRRVEEVVEREEPIRSGELDPAEAAARHEDQQLVREALAVLSPRQQACLVLRAQGLSYAEIAAALEVAPGSIGTILARAESDLKRRYLALVGSVGDAPRQG